MAPSSPTAAVLAVMAGALVGLAPMWASARPDVAHGAAGRGRGVHRCVVRRRRLRRGLVVARWRWPGAGVQAGLLTRSFAALLDVDPGFATDHLLTLQAGMPDRLRGPEQRRAFYREFSPGCAHCRAS